MKFRVEADKAAMVRVASSETEYDAVGSGLLVVRCAAKCRCSYKVRTRVC